MLNLHEITGTEYVARTFRLRFEVWSEETELKPAITAQRLITDPHDNHARHWAVFEGSRMIAAARMCVHARQEDTPDASAFAQVHLPSPIATINRLVVHKSARGHGLGIKLCTCRIQAAKQDGATCVVGTAVEPRISSLERLGFRLIGRTGFQAYAESLLFHAMVLEFGSDTSVELSAIR